MITYKDELYHHGIKGQKWGVRRFRNEDGTLTKEGKQRYSGDSSQKKPLVTGKRIAAITAGVAVTAAAIYVAKHPEIVKNVTNGAAMKAAMPHAKAASKIKSGLSTVGNSAKAGVKSGIQGGTEKIVTAAVAGSVMLAGKKALDHIIGQNTAGQIMNANNKKKIGSFWNYKDPTSSPKDDDDD